MKMPFVGCVVALALTQQVHAVSLEWLRQIGTPDDDQSYGVSADGFGNVYIVGLTEGSVGGPSAGVGDAFAAKYDASLNLQWIRQFGTTQSDGGLGISALDWEAFTSRGSLKSFWMACFRDRARHS